MIAGVASLTAARAAESPISPPAVATAPDWLRKPSAEDLQRYWPADSRGVDGRAVISCIVTSRGSLDDCKVTSEVPTGHGSGGAALLLAPSFLMRPMTRDGVAVGGAQVNIPINFKSGGPIPAGLYPANPNPTMQVALTLAWAQTPTAADMSAAFPRQSVGGVASWHVVLLCGVSGKGTLENCHSTSEHPSGHGFAKAALGLVKDFRVTGDAAPKGVRDLRVQVPFDFRDPNQGAPPAEIVAPEWLVAPDSKMAGKLFPPEAAKAGFKTGIATLACAVTHEGRLVDCTVAGESPAGLGFGRSALAVAAVMVMNPWTAQGLPVDGARLRLPIRLNLAQEPPATSRPPSP